MLFKNILRKAGTIEQFRLRISTCAELITDPDVLFGRIDQVVGIDAFNVEASIASVADADMRGFGSSGSSAKSGRSSALSSPGSGFGLMFSASLVQ